MPKENKRSDKLEVAKRIDEVLAIRLGGAQRHEVLQFASEQGWGLTDRQIDTYIRKADDLAIEQQEKSRRRLLGMHRAKRGALYARAINASDHGTALRVLDSEAKLLGLFPEPGAKEVAKVLTQQAKQIAELEARLASHKRDEEDSQEARQTPGIAPGGNGGADSPD